MGDHNLKCKSKSPVRMLYIVGAMAIVVPICAIIYAFIADRHSNLNIYDTTGVPHNGGKPQAVYIAPSVSGSITANIDVPVSVQIATSLPCVNIQSSIRVRGDLNYMGPATMSSVVCENYTHDVVVYLPFEKTGFLIVDVEFISTNSKTYQASKAIYFSTITDTDTTLPSEKTLEAPSGEKLIVIPVE